MTKIDKEKFINLIKELVKEKLEKGRGLLEVPPSNKIDKILSEKIDRILKRKKSD